MANKTNNLSDLLNANDLFSSQATRDEAKLKKEDGNIMIALDKLIDFKNHPFKVVHDNSMEDLIESITARGVLDPLVVRRKDEDLYEIISGHRRKYAAKQAGLTEVPCVIKDSSDDDAIIMMVDYNKYREKILPSEKAFSYRMKMEALKEQGKRTDLTSSQVATKTDTAAEIGKAANESRDQVFRYIRLTYLIPELLNMVDADKLKFVMAVDISYLTEEMQRWLYGDVMSKYVIKPAQITELRKQLQSHTFDKTEFVKFFEPKTKPISTPKQISTAKISKFFPPHCGEKDIEKILEKVLSTTTAKKIIEELTGYNAEE